VRPPAPAACQFGGDGAVAAVPPECEAATRAALAALAHWSDSEMKVPLRVGMVPVHALTEAGLEAMAALHHFGNGDAFGLFLGTGVPTAENWVKADARWRIDPRPGPLPGLDGLSCRWRPVPARRGLVLCVIADPVVAGAEGLAALGRLRTALERVVETAAASPLGQGEHLAPRMPTGHSLALEARTEPRRRRPLRMIKAIVGSALLTLGHRLGGRLGPLDVARYRRGIAERSDYRKQAGGPRLVLDVTPDEADAIEAVLAEAEAKGEIVSGTARAEATVITCLVGDFSADRHVHFVDGAALGFWRASVVLKEKLAKGRETPTNPRDHHPEA
jgi:hypothetical protein